jgi:hypothetical protein
MVLDGDRRLTCGLHAHYWILAQSGPALSSLQGPAGLLTDAALVSHLAENRPAFHATASDAQHLAGDDRVAEFDPVSCGRWASAAPAAPPGPAEGHPGIGVAMG